MGAHDIQITLPDGTRRPVQAGSTAAEALGGKSLKKDVLAVKVNGVARDLSAVLTSDVSLEPVTFDSSDGKDVYRHTSTHIMAQAVKELFPSAQLTIGPSIDEGFYYDFAFDRPFTPDDLEKIEARAADPTYHLRLERACLSLRAYLQDERHWASRNAPGLGARPVAYFSAEFGLHESLPVYSGAWGSWPAIT
jgi:hypothetical protein